MISAETLLGCCGSTRWAAAVAAGMPFPDLGDLLTRAETLWWGLAPDDWREALAAHPRIGEQPVAGSQERREQAGAECAATGVLAAIASGNRAYEERFGMTYVVRATGRSAPELLALLHDRLAGEPADELQVAAREQWEITALRLTRLWEQQ